MLHRLLLLLVLAQSAWPALALTSEQALKIASGESDSRIAALNEVVGAADPALAGYWGASTFEAALDTVLSIINANVSRVDGIKISLLDAAKEVALRRHLPASVRMYTGDNFSYPELMQGDDQGYSHALLGIFDPLAAAAADAVTRLGAGDVAGFRAVLDPTVPLARLIFRAPTQNYKTGVVFMAWLNGHQDHSSC